MIVINNILNNRRSNLYQAVVLQILKYKLATNIGDVWSYLEKNYICAHGKL